MSDIQNTTKYYIEFSRHVGWHRSGIQFDYWGEAAEYGSMFPGAKVRVVSVTVTEVYSEVMDVKKQ